MNCRIIFTDIDGTLLNADRVISDYTVEQIKKIKNNIPFILVSSRMPEQMTYFQEQIDDTGQALIAYNGALVIHNDRVIHSCVIPSGIIEELIRFNETLSAPVHLSLYNGSSWTVEAMDFWARREQNNTRVTPVVESNRETLAAWKKLGTGAHKVMCMGDPELMDAIFDHARTAFGDELHLYRSKDTYIEIANKQVSKLTGIQQLLDAMPGNFTLEEAMAFGDNYNDIEMLQAVGTGVAVENARPELLSVADEVTAHHKEDGVGRFLEAYFQR